MAEPEYDCATCDNHVCREGIDCYGDADLVRRVYAETDEPCRALMRAAARVESEGYLRWPRVLEVVRFAQAAGFSHLGLAYCIGLAEEARACAEILQRRFRVSSVCCKVCGVPKEELGLAQLSPGDPDEVMCAPLGQAELLNRAGTELNVLLGLCVGHDALFSRHARAPTTTLVVKDRVLAHNPAGALYSRYTRKLIEKLDAEDSQA
jgi:uncharacterized metal-binding protein